MPGDSLDPRTYAADSRLFLAVHATGVQKYACQAKGTWLLTDPEAVLYTDQALRHALPKAARADESED